MQIVTPQQGLGNLIEPLSWFTGTRGKAWGKSDQPPSAMRRRTAEGANEGRGAQMDKGSSAPQSRETQALRSHDGDANLVFFFLDFFY